MSKTYLRWTNSCLMLGRAGRSVSAARRPGYRPRAFVMPEVHVAYDVRDSYAWRKLRDQVVREEPACWLQLPGCTGLSQTADHVLSYESRPDLAMERSNHRGACNHCNRMRRDMPIEALQIGVANRPRGGGRAPALGVFE